MTQDRIDYLNSITFSQELIDKLSEATSVDEAFKLIEETGVEFTKEDLDYCSSVASKFMKENNLLTDNGELTVEMLDMVSGGGKILRKIAGSLMIVAGTGLIIAGGATSELGIGVAVMYAGSALAVTGYAHMH